eukprot:CAMPEP_0194298350 /NCGR_PEP_ID=MMETSP0169-20130528/60116_1 /TAXON_ID=218684 /ORGANISM="Corethron pennatum, Strain L29A3" /LENGTH=1251 /DNA_ID=CAMNT_0039048327 /DNA_START=1167 /DNA_END=4922 /DNA_ORIENTATION=-
MKLNIDILCGGDMTKPLCIEVLDYKKRRKNLIIGRLETSVDELLKMRAKAKVADGSNSLSLKINKYTVGLIIVTEASLILNESVKAPSLPKAKMNNNDSYVASPAENIYPGVNNRRNSTSKFLEYLSGGCELSLCVAIDFSSCNAAGERQSLHHINENGRLNEYEKVIYAVGSVLIRYDSDNKVPVWGFGVEFNGETRNCFQCGNDIEVNGINGIIEAYRSTLKQNFAVSKSKDWSKVIDNAVKFARKAQNDAKSSGKLNYTVLLILSHGIVDDLAKTINAINESKSTPLSNIASPAENSFSGLNNIPKFLEYLSGGCEFSLCVAIDFSSCNDNSAAGERQSLHHIHENGRLNEYEIVIHAVGSILMQYDSDNKAPVWGFGVELNGETRNCFQCGNNVEVDGVNGIIDAYRGTLKKEFAVSKSKDWSRVINNAAKFARKAQNDAKSSGKLNYTVLLILSHGIVDDLAKTVNAINESKSTPLSIVIVGVGGADFSEITKVKERCTFVKFRDHSHASLSKVALSKVPMQLEQYFMERGIFPKPPRSEILDKTDAIILASNTPEIPPVHNILDNSVPTISSLPGMTIAVQTINKIPSLPPGHKISDNSVPIISSFPGMTRDVQAINNMPSLPPGHKILDSSVPIISSNKYGILSGMKIDAKPINMSALTLESHMPIPKDMLPSNKSSAVGKRIDVIEEIPSSTLESHMPIPKDSHPSHTSGAVEKRNDIIEEIGVHTTDTGTILETLQSLSEVCPFNICVAIDFTLSNGYPGDRRSLHFRDTSGQCNEYERAIEALCPILSKCAIDNKVSLRGFGVEINGEANQCFQMGEEGEVFGVEGVLDSYRNVLNETFVMSSCKDWNVAITNASRFSMNAQTDARSYTVLVIFSNGLADEVTKTINALEEAKSFPLSVVVVGVGEANFNEITAIFSNGPADEVTKTINALEQTKSSPLSVVVIGVGEANFNEITEMLEERNSSSCFVNFRDHSDTMSSLAGAALSKIPQQYEEYYKNFPIGNKINKSAEPVFSNYLSRGYQFSLCLAIDFSASNGNPRSQQSLHYVTDGKLNDYEKAIIKLCSMFIKYDSDSKVPVRGFGIDLGGSPNHCFQMGSKLEADGIGDILNTYRSASQQTFDMSLSKDWSVVILNAIDFARKSQNDANFSGVHNYSVLLILSNGPVDNIDATIDALHEVASVPLSVVVVGIGDSDFSEITQLLEGDLGNDVITFVNFHDDLQKLKELEEIALCKVAHQLEHYFI